MLEEEYSTLFIYIQELARIIRKIMIEIKNSHILNILIEFEDMIGEMLNNKKHNAIVTELFFRGRKLNISLDLLHNLILLSKKC